MILCHRIGQKWSSNWNYIYEIQASEGPISFDGIYSELLFHLDELAGKDIILFPMGQYAGGTNAFDVGEMPGSYLTWSQVKYVANRLNARIGYHTWSHRDLTKLPDAEVLAEILPPVEWELPLDYFAYPNGRVDARVAKLVQEAGYKEAWAAGPYGDGSQYQRRRNYIGW